MTRNLIIGLIVVILLAFLAGTLIGGTAALIVLVVGCLLLALQFA